MKSSAISLVAVFAVLASSALAQEPPPLTDDQILSRCRAEMDHMQQAQSMGQYSFTKRITAGTHDKNGKTTHEDEREYEFVPRSDGRFNLRLLSVKGAPPTEKELKQHEKEMSKEFAKSNEKVAEDKKKAQEEELTLSRFYLEEFDFKFAGRDDWYGTPAFLIEYAPKPKDAQPKDKKERILGKMAGHMWFSQSRFRILGSEMHNLESIKSFGGLSGADHIIQRTEYFPTTSGPYMPKVDSVEWELRIGLFNKFRFSRKEEYSNFQMVETKSTVTPPS